MPRAKKTQASDASSKITLFVCAECGMEIGTGGLCSYGCKHDADDLNGRPIQVAKYLLAKLHKPRLLTREEIDSHFRPR